MDHELNELDLPPAGFTSVAATLSFDDWVRRIPLALAALVAWFFLFPVLLGPTGPGVAVLMTSLSTWFVLGRSAPPRGQAYLVAVGAPFALLLLLIT